MCMQCNKDGSCCKGHLAAKGAAMIILAAAILAVDQGYLKISYAMLIAIVLALVGLKKLIMTTVWKDEAPKKKGKK